MLGELVSMAGKVTWLLLAVLALCFHHTEPFVFQLGSCSASQLERDTGSIKGI